MNEQKLKPGHFWAEVWDDSRDNRKRIVIDVCGNECICVCGGPDQEHYFNDESYDTITYKNFKKLEPPKMRYMTNEEMAEFVIDNPCIVRCKIWAPESWAINTEMNKAIDPKDYLWKKRFKDDWQEFLTEDK